MIISSYSMSLNKALFLDRDGTIIFDCCGVLKVEKIELKIGLKNFLLKALDNKYKIVMVTNQTAVSKGLTSYSKMKKVNDILISKINDLVGQVVFSDVFICPYHPMAQIKRFRTDSYFRKPKPGMLIKARNQLNVDLKKSILVGDRVSDIVAGNLAGCSTVLLSGNKHSDEMIKTNLKFTKKDMMPDYKVDRLDDIINIMDLLS